MQSRGTSFFSPLAIENRCASRKLPTRPDRMMHTTTWENTRMHKLATSMFISILSLLPAAAASAQFEQSDRQYAEKQNAERHQTNMIKLYVSGAVLIVAGGVWVVTKLRE